jgi:hypothetical protein
MQPNENVFTARVPSLLDPGTYQLFAVLEGGVTKDNVRFSQMQSPDVVIKVRDLKFWERHGRKVKIILVVLPIIFIVWKFGYPILLRLISGWGKDFDALDANVR